MADLVDALGIASARIYAAYGSKEELFREAIALYESGEGGFAERALREEATARDALTRIFRDAIHLYTRPDRPGGCMVVSSATNCSKANETVGQWLADHRRARTASIVARLVRAVREGELPKHLDVRALGDHFAAFLHGLSVQARDGVSRQRLLNTVPVTLSLLPVRDEPRRK